MPKVTMNFAPGSIDIWFEEHEKITNRMFERAINLARRRLRAQRTLDVRGTQKKEAEKLSKMRVRVEELAKKAEKPTTNSEERIAQ